MHGPLMCRQSSLDNSYLMSITTVILCFRFSLAITDN